ncbi:histone-lysine N-methyltransferase SMYD3 [Cololabis saira]|uniref:histone-lysine N-methyltransferase SMYD3 n=1 Tax=Cololabis saira TaxID=129043 RepID=UPI002AD459B6|nr:histone-lysine N-methyltransferase SMYD3 [Cololabis saira]
MLVHVEGNQGNPAMAPVERFVSPGKGNGLRATARIRRGELVTSAEPLACCVSRKHARSVCHHCFTRQETLLRCSQCKMARYCNSTCQKQAWSGHKRECKCLCSLRPRLPTDSVCLAARLIFALLSPSRNSSEELYTFDEHESHLNSMSEEKKQGLSQLALMLELYIKQEVPDLTQEITPALPLSCREAISVIAKVTCNCFTISDRELQEIGVGLYPSLSLLNHDCRPNCVMMFEGTKLQLRAVRDINPEEELTISYVESLSLTGERQGQLEDQYHFTCRCQRCDSQEKDGLMLSGEEATWRRLKEARLRLEGLKAESNWGELLEGCRHLLTNDAGEVPDENLHKLRITDLALDASVHLGHWEEALTYGVKTLPAYGLYFPDPHPVHGIQLMRIGKLQHFLDHTEEALDTFKQAFKIIKLTHGGDHPLTNDLMMKMEECRCEMHHQSSSTH